MIVRSRRPGLDPDRGDWSRRVWTRTTTARGPSPDRATETACAGAVDLRPLIERLSTQRLVPLDRALAATDDGLPAARRLIVLSSRSMAGIPGRALAPDDTRIVS